jgi:hypothetical protein
MGTFRELGENILETTKSKIIKKHLEINISMIPNIIWNQP